MEETFTVTIHSCDNSTWQGIVVTPQGERPFRSELELILILSDSMQTKGSDAFLRTQVLMDAFCSHLSCFHSQDYGGCAGHGIAAGVHAFLGGLSGAFFCNDALSLINFQSFRGTGDQRVR